MGPSLRRSARLQSRNEPTFQYQNPQVDLSDHELIDYELIEQIIIRQQPPPTQHIIMEDNVRNMIQEALAIRSCRIQLLNSKNYYRWKREMILYLKSAKLYDIVIQIPNEPDERWVDKDNTALVEIHNVCEPDQ